MSLVQTMLLIVERKEGGALKAVSGMPSLQFSLVSIMELVHEGVLTVEQLVQKMCHAPAELFQIESVDISVRDIKLTWFWLIRIANG